VKFSDKKIGVFKLSLTGFKKEPTDHYSSIFCNKQKFGLKDSLDSHPTCVGSDLAHYHHLEYMKWFMESYEGVGRFAFHHMLTGNLLVDFF
jgi:hypothetical protein